MTRGQASPERLTVYIILLQHILLLPRLSQNGNRESMLCFVATCKLQNTVQSNNGHNSPTILCTYWIVQIIMRFEKALNPWWHKCVFSTFLLSYAQLLDKAKVRQQTRSLVPCICTLSWWLLLCVNRRLIISIISHIGTPAHSPTPVSAILLSIDSREECWPACWTYGRHLPAVDHISRLLTTSRL